MLIDLVRALFQIQHQMCERAVDFIFGFFLLLLVANWCERALDFIFAFFFWVLFSGSFCCCWSPIGVNAFGGLFFGCCWFFGPMIVREACVGPCVVGSIRCRYRLGEIHWHEVADLVTGARYTGMRWTIW